VDYVEEVKFTVSTCLFISHNCVGEWLLNTQNSSCSEQLFSLGNDIAHGSNRGGGWA